MRKRAAITILFALLASGEVSFAGAPIQEVVRPQGLLVLEDFSQWTTLSYEFSGHNTNVVRASSDVNRFREKYDFNLLGAIVDPHLASLSLAGELGLEQAIRSDETTGSQTTKAFQYQYNFTASLFDQAPLPVVLFTSREQRTVVSPFTPTYTTDSFANGITAVLHNKYTPVLFRYARISSDITGLTSETTTTTTDNFLLQVEHSIPDRSLTRIMGSVGLQNQVLSAQTSTSSRNYTVALSNGLQLDRQGKYSLGSSLDGSEAISGEIPQRTLHWQEALDARFGKALTGKLVYRLDYDRTQGLNNTTQTSQFNDISGALTHRLYASLDTAVSGHYRTGELLGGTETVYGGAASITYRKNLPRGSNLFLTAKGEHEVTDRLVPGTQRQVPDELHKVDAQNGFFLNLIGSELVVTSVKRRNPNTFVDLLLVEHVDYEVDAAGRIRVLFPVDPDTEFRVTYQLQFAPQVTYSTDTYTTAATLSLLDGKYRIMGNYLSQNQNVLSNDPGNVTLYNSRSATLHVDLNYLPSVYSAEYGTYTSGPTDYSYWEAGWRVDYYYENQALSFKLRDRYLNRKIADATGSTEAENTAEAGVTYARPLFSWAMLSTAFNYVSIRGDSLQSDFAYIKADLKGRINKLTLNLTGQSTLRLRRGETARDDYFLLEVKRYF